MSLGTIRGYCNGLRKRLDSGSKGKTEQTGFTVLRGCEVQGDLRSFSPSERLALSKCQRQLEKHVERGR